MENKLHITHEKFTLENGLDVIFHLDKTDPIVSVAILYHVGSSREEKGKTGFAHLFEHMLFQESENVRPEEFFKKINDAGGSLNGGTWQDGTIYYEIVPKDSLEMVLWLESDRMGYFINTINKKSLHNQQEVVINEKRQRFDNQPYGYKNYIIDKLLFPENHPYNWQVIGSMEDIQNATVQDVKDFYKKFYKPNNATLVIAGDFETENAKKLVEKYFGEIKKGRKVKTLAPIIFPIEKTKKYYYEDNFANLPEISLVWPTVQMFHKDSYALNFLAELLTGEKKSPLYKLLVKNKKLTSNVSAVNRTLELAGKFQINVRAFPDISLNEIENAIFEGLKIFEENEINNKTIESIKAKLETHFYSNLSLVLNKAFQLASYNTFAGSPGYIQKDIENIKNVTKEDIVRVYKKYIKNKPYISVNVLPKGKSELAVSKSKEYIIEEENIIEESENKQVYRKRKIKKLPSVFDRSIEPPKGEPPVLKLPKIWSEKFKNGFEVYGIEHTELPIIQFKLVLEGGMFLENPQKVGITNILSSMLMEGTKRKTPEELEDAINILGSSIYIDSDKEEIAFYGRTLSRNYKKTMDILSEIILEPRWDKKEFEIIKQKTLNMIMQFNSNPSRIANKVFKKLIYGKDNILSNSIFGEIETVKKITIKDLKEYYEKYFSPSVAKLLLVGDIEKKDVRSSLFNLESNWKTKDILFPDYIKEVTNNSKNKLYFVDVPNAKQSVIYVGKLSLPYDDKNYYSAQIMNYKFGGNFNSYINLILREKKGYTYGAGSYFYGSKNLGPFMLTTSVKTNTTYDSLKIIKEELETYHSKFSEEDLLFTKNSMLRSNAMRFESYDALISMLEDIAVYKFPINYVKRQEKIIQKINRDEIINIANKYLDYENMTYLVVGDAETQLDKLKNLGLGNPILIDINLKQVKK